MRQPSPPHRRDLLLSILVGLIAVSALSPTVAASPEDKPADSTESKPIHIHLISGSREYKSEPSLKAWKKHLEERYSNVTVTASWGKDGGRSLPNLEPLAKADVMVVFLRRNKLPEDQLKQIKSFWESGKAIIGIRPASHAFDRETNKTWDAKVLGGSYSGHGSGEDKIEISIPKEAVKHPVLAGIQSWTRAGKLYRNPKNAEGAVTLLVGKGEKETQPVAWVYERAKDLGGGRSFYTSLGYPHDFEHALFRRLLANAIEWTTQRKLVATKGGDKQDDKGADAKADPVASTADEQGFVSLFDGRTLKGWTNPYDWGEAKVVNGEIHLTGDKKWFLLVDRPFANFIFEGEVKMPKEGKANSGFMFRAHQEKNKVWGYQAEVDPSDRAWSGGLYDEGRRKWLHPKQGDKAAGQAFSSRDDPFKHGEWNHYRISAVGDHLQIWVNGVKTTDIRDSVDAKGYVGIQHHGEKGQTYAFRNLRIRVLPDGKAKDSE